MRRGTINARYGDVIEALFGDAPEVSVSSTVTYQDGSTAEREVSLRIESMNGSSEAAQRPLAGASR